MFFTFFEAFSVFIWVFNIIIIVLFLFFLLAAIIAEKIVELLVLT